MDAEDYQQMKESAKTKKAVALENNADDIEAWCQANNVESKDITEYQVRVFAKHKIDIWPTSKKYHNITTNQRGTIRGSIANFLTKINQ